MYIRDEILNDSKNFINLCREHKVKYLYAFGSSLDERFDREISDVDLLVEIDDPDPIERGEKLMSLWDTFESFFQRKVDLLTEASIKNPYLRKSIDANKMLIYDGEGIKIPG